MLVYIKPKSVFAELHSDTLFGAMVSAMADLFPSKVNEMVKNFESGNPPFIISSTFPFIENDNGEKIRFLPKFSVDEDFSSIENRDVFKEYKGIDFLQELIAIKILKGELLLTDILNNLDEYIIVGNLLLANESDVDKPFKNIVLPNNSVDRLDNSTKIFYSEGKNFHKNSGVFFLIKIFDRDYEPIIKSIFRLLKDRGFGKDISNGKGQFDYVIEDMDIEDIISIDNTNNFITLSRYIPYLEKDEVNNDASYEIGFKRSISRSFDIRKQVRFFKEGSSFRGQDDFYGIAVTTGENAIEYGFAFPLKYYKE